MTHATIRAALLACGFTVGACAQTPDATPQPAIEAPIEAGAEATAAGQIIGIDGAPIGAFDIEQGPHGLMLRVEVQPGSLSPGWHGLHFHAVGDCSDVGEFKRSGGHVGMIEGGHGLMNPVGPEPGDLTNIWAAADGSAGAEMLTALVDLPTLLDEDGTALIIHANEDDHVSQPIGGAGARIACGVVAVG